MLAFNVGVPVLPVSTAVKIIVPLVRTGCHRYTFDTQYPLALTNRVSPADYAATIDRLNGCLSGTFNRFRIWLICYLLSFVVMMYFIFSFSWRAYNWTWWWIWVVVWVAASIVNRRLWWRSTYVALQNVQAELNAANGRFPGTSWRMAQHGTRGWFARYVHIEIDLNIEAAVPVAMPFMPVAGAVPVAGYAPPMYGQQQPMYGQQQPMYQPVAPVAPGKY